METFQKYDFVLLFALRENETPEEWLDDLCEKGSCDDSSISWGSGGFMACAFITEGPSARETIEDAVMRVKKVVPHAILTCVEPDMVNLNEAARYFGYSRAEMTVYAEKSGFPNPAAISSPPTWHMWDIARWMNEYTDCKPDMVTMDALSETALVAMRINAFRTLSRSESEAVRLLVPGQNKSPEFS